MEETTQKIKEREIKPYSVVVAGENESHAVHRRYSPSAIPLLPTLPVGYRGFSFVEDDLISVSTTSMEDQLSIRRELCSRKKKNWRRIVWGNLGILSTVIVIWTLLWTCHANKNFWAKYSYSSPKCGINLNLVLNFWPKS